MADISSWRGDWYERLYKRVRSRGFDTVTAFAAAQPRATLFALADELGPEDVNVAQLLTALVDEAEHCGSVDRLSRSLLVHELWEFIPKGWRMDPGDGFDFDFKAASAIGTASAALPEPARDLVRQVGRAMIAAELPIGWLPDGPDDPILSGFFDRARHAI